MRKVESTFSTAAAAAVAAVAAAAAATACKWIADGLVGFCSGFDKAQLSQEGG